jgi:hypothetical protein
MRCQCCGQPYRRGAFRCCAAPGRSDRWLEAHCATCRKCPRHCACNEREPDPPLSFDNWRAVAASKAMPDVPAYLADHVPPDDDAQPSYLREHR